MIRSALASSKSRITGGSSVIQRLHSANNASNSCADVGAVTTILHGYRVIRNHNIAHEAAVDFPVPWPERTLIRRSPLATAFRNSDCQGSGVTFNTIFTKFTGLFRYDLKKLINGFVSSVLISIFPYLLCGGYCQND